MGAEAPVMIQQKHWQRPDQLMIVRDANFGYKYFRKGDVERRIAEGWEVCHKDEKVMKDTGSVDKSQTYRSMILMRMPIHMVNERNTYYQDKHRRRIRAAGKGASLAAAAGRAGTTDNKNSDELAGAVGTGLKMNQGVRTNDGLVHTSVTSIPIAKSVEELNEDPQLKIDIAGINESRVRQTKDEEVLLDVPKGDKTPKTVKGGK